MTLDSGAKIVNDFRSRYVLTYTPRNVSATGWHRIEVSLTNRKGSPACEQDSMRALQY